MWLNRRAHLPPKNEALSSDLSTTISTTITIIKMKKYKACGTKRKRCNQKGEVRNSIQ